MTLFKKPSQLTAKPGLVAMIYGSPGSGKSTLACSAPGAVMIDTDGGVMRINGAHQVPTLQVTKWEEIADAVREAKESPEIHTIVIDTVGKMLDFMSEYIIRTATGKKVEVDRLGNLSLKGYGVRKTMFSNFIKNITIMGKNVIFVAHDKEVKRGEDTVLRPEVGGSSTDDLMKELDLVGYMEMNGANRTISFTPTERYYAKNSCDMPGVINVPVLIDDKGNIVKDNNFFGDVIQAYRKRIARNIENNAKLEDLKELLEVNLESVETAEDANNYIKWVAGLDHVYNSKVIAFSLIQNKAKALGLTYDKTTKTFSNAGEA